ncbi:reverse transcriptase-like protein [Ornithinibacillus halophilus]|uniref:Ribonuclease HI n=1 Tax=Ornithinibacillus halophilus TaxID=930117 RepID=A0A1M5IKH7_9BACI|nr:reverse transcriptase-like protein [Ornithinibacillus halophilus]SHG28283.1 ribonuclease HI [Ornithinibacillus halophilus]
MDVKLELVYSTPKGTTVDFTSDMMRAEKALLIIEDLEKTKRLKHITIIDRYDSTWTIKDLMKHIEGIQTEPHNITVYFDGGYDIQTKKSGIGCAIYYEQNGKTYRLRKNTLIEELESNNEAEYAAFHLALQELELMGVHHLTVTFVGDSQVVINQMNEEWPVYEEELSKWADRLEQKMEQLGIQPEYKLVPRKRNREADQLASQALNHIDITSVMELPN